MTALLRAARPSLSRRSIAALANSRYALVQQAQRAAFSSTPQNALPSAQSLFASSSTVGGPPTSYFQRSTLPANTIIKFVPQQTAWIVERMGRFNRILQPGLAVLVPIIDRIAYVKSLKESAIEIPSQSAITADNVTLELDGVLYTRVFDPYKARYVYGHGLNLGIQLTCQKLRSRRRRIRHLSISTDDHAIGDWWINTRQRAKGTCRAEH